jgi:dTDP-4-dehydrorhamnose 3,5-epimerase
MLTLHATPLPGLTVVESTPVGDARGSFARLFCARELAALDLPGPVVQINRSLSPAVGTVRGMHFQRPPMAEAKLVRCLRGRVFDVAVDLRRGSPTYLKWHGVELSAQNNLALYLPRGFAHGFQTLASEAELLYLHTEYYSPEHEGGLRHDDPALAIAWPLPPANLSERDGRHPLLAEGFEALEIS